MHAELRILSDWKLVSFSAAAAAAAATTAATVAVVSTTTQHSCSFIIHSVSIK